MPLIRLALPGESLSIPANPKKRQKQGARCMIQGICWCRTYFCHILWLKLVSQAIRNWLGRDFDVPSRASKPLLISDAAVWCRCNA